MFWIWPGLFYEVDEWQWRARWSQDWQVIALCLPSLDFDLCVKLVGGEEGAS